MWPRSRIVVASPVNGAGAAVPFPEPAVAVDEAGEDAGAIVADGRIVMEVAVPLYAVITGPVAAGGATVIEVVEATMTDAEMVMPTLPQMAWAKARAAVVGKQIRLAWLFHGVASPVGLSGVMDETTRTRLFLLSTMSLDVCS